jgi:membrane-bound inhibitor of C-type lysozyme
MKRLAPLLLCGADPHRAAMRLGLPWLALLLAGCGSLDLWPFGESTAPPAERKPENAAEYRCDQARRFYVRNLQDGALWLILPDRQIRLERSSGAAGGRYGAGRVVLELSGDTAALADPPLTYSGCKRAG